MSWDKLWEENNISKTKIIKFFLSNMIKTCHSVNKTVHRLGDSKVLRT